MDIKRWLKEDKGGFGAFLILVIVGLAFYALERKEPVEIYNLTEIESATATEPVVNRKPITATAFSDSVTEDKLNKIDSATIAREPEKEPVKPEVTKPPTKPKVRAKPAKRKISKEELVRSKLRAGMSVRQIAKATGLEKKYIREIKRKKE